MRKICIVATYFQRQFQLNKTLESISKSAHDNFEVVIVDDNSPDDIILPKYDYPITVIKIRDKKWTNPEPAYNTGIAFALSHNPDIVILQNAENYHVGDVLSYANTVTEANYISFGCYSLNQQTTFTEHDIDQVIHANNYGATANGENSWYNHPIHRPVGYDFCSAITASNIQKLNGYDERFSEGYAYGDDNLLDRIKKLGLRIEITHEPFVVHQWHYSREQLPNQQQLVDRNLELFKKLSLEPNIKAQHLFTPDL